MNNIDFEAIIKSAMKDGSKTEDLAAAFTEALNAINSENARETDRLSWIDDRLDWVVDSVNENNESLETVAKLFAAVAAKTNSDWNLDTCKRFEESMSDFLPEMIKTFNEFNKGFDNLVGILSKSKDKARQGAVRIVQSADKAKEALSDSEKINKFLKDIFGV